MHVLITGADGLIGSHLTEALVRQGHTVRAFVLYNSFNSWGWLEHCAPDVASVRFIAHLDTKGPKLIKGIQLEGLRVIGDPQTHPQNAKSPFSATKIAGVQLADPHHIKF